MHIQESPKIEVVFTFKISIWITVYPILPPHLWMCPLTVSILSKWSFCCPRNFIVTISFLKSLLWIYRPSFSMNQKVLIGWVSHTGRGEEALAARNSIKPGSYSTLTLVKVIHTKNASTMIYTATQLRVRRVKRGAAWEEAASLHRLAQFRFTLVAITSNWSPSATTVC